MKIKPWLSGLGLMLGPLAAVAAGDFADPGKLAQLWQQDIAKPGYDQYMQAFVQYNNSLHLDSEGNCYKVAKAPVTLYLVIEDRYVTYVTPETDDEKSLCFRKSYLGLRTKAPPFSPFVIKMQF